MAMIRNREVITKQGSLMHYSNRDAVGTKVSGHYRQGGCLSGVSVKRGTTVICRNEILTKNQDSKVFRYISTNTLDECSIQLR